MGFEIPRYSWNDICWFSMTRMSKFPNPIDRLQNSKGLYRLNLSNNAPALSPYDNQAFLTFKNI